MATSQATSQEGPCLPCRPARRRTTAEVHDYVDEHVGVLAAMWRKRSRSYAQLGFTAVDGGG
ncbi:hypothetical protein ACFY2R_22090 [Micromonospora olivasterospora]|uniref:Uncharacterized protein n=1 Tax=Micromonospora olivasterospora TaxID=1880 RepID=A0A562IAM2_MICOL|nr:hypothetical protein [Micromonospora olivasterospora]TWH67775.1 hypothetical protein JD77_02760 [Micromonospora olivasterospora]